MAKRTKILKKRIEGIRVQKEKHELKIETEEGNKDTTHGYWQKEIEQFKKQEEILKEKLKKLTGKDDRNIIDAENKEKKDL